MCGAHERLLLQRDQPRVLSEVFLGEKDVLVDW